MFIHLFVYRLKCLLRDRMMVFWTLIFPLVLGTFFSMAFMNLTQDDAFSPIHAALVSSSGAQAAAFDRAVRAVSSGKDRLFDLKEASSEAEAARWLDAGKVEGILSYRDGPRLTVKETGLNQSIMKMFADEYRQTVAAARDITASRPDALQHGLIADLTHEKALIRQVNAGNAKPNDVLIYFFSLIAMACLYGSFWGNKEMIDVQANLSARAARLNVAPVHKLKLFLAGILADFVILYLEILILLAYLHFALHIDFGPRTGLVVVTACAGALLGLSFGTFVSALLKKSEGMKFAVLIAATMAGCIMAGMMSPDIKYIIDIYAPPLAWLNPVNLLTDAFYALYYYDSLGRYAENMYAMLAFIAVFGTLTVLIVRRRKYASL